MVSFLSLIEKTSEVSFIDEALLRHNIELTNGNRCDYLMSPQGIIGQSYHALYQAFQKGYKKNILLIEYENLISQPQTELNRIYDFFGMSRFTHQFENVQPKYEENDTVYRLKDMHRVRNKIQKINRDNSKYLSDYVIDKYNHMEFWRKVAPRYFIFGV